jgi:ABC-type transporter Mla MlaB component
METHYKITTTTHPEKHSVVLLLDGKFDKEAIAELNQSICQAKGDQQTIYIDLSEVTLVDRKAVQYISGQASEDVRLVNCPNYLRRWIAQVSDEVES